MSAVRFAFGLATVTALAGPVAAGGLNEPIVTPAPAPIAVAPAPVVVSSDWTGGYVGGSLGYGDVSGSTTLGEDVNGLTYGLHGGYMVDLGSFVLGGELEYSVTDDIVDDSIDLTVDSVARAKLRAGYDLGSFLPYAVAGVAQVTTSGAIADDDTGYLYGLGVDYAITDNWVAGAEILQHEFEDYAGSGIDVSATTASLRMSYSF